jgi:ATP-binding cassette, subfamily G (WHITE), member 2, SNQ2
MYWVPVNEVRLLTSKQYDNRDGLGPNQICTVFGSTPGDTLVNGRAYINATYDLNASDLWRRNFIVLVVFFFFFQLTQMIVVEFFPVSFSLCIVAIVKDGS